MLIRTRLTIALLMAACCGVLAAAEIGQPLDDDDDAAMPGVAAAFDPELDDAGMLDLEPLLVAPLWVYDDPQLGLMQAYMRVPPAAQRLLASAGVQIAMHDERAAAATLAQALALTQQQRGADDPAVLLVVLRLAQLDESRLDWAAAAARYRRAYASIQASAGPQSPWLTSMLWREASALVAGGDLAGARAAGERAIVQLAQRGGSPVERLAAANNRAILQLAGGDGASARSAFESLIAQMREQYGAAPSLNAPFWLTPRLWSNLGLAHWVLGDPSAALDCYRRALAERAPWMGASGMTERAVLLRSQVDAQELNAIVTLERALAQPAAQPLGLAALFERKGALLDRDARGVASLRETSTPLPERSANPLARLFDPGGSAWQRVQQQAEQAWRGQNRDLLRRQDEALQQRAALERERPVTDAEIAAHAAALDDVERRRQEIGREIAQRAEGRPMMEQLMRQLSDGNPQTLASGLAIGPELTPEVAIARATSQHAERTLSQRAALPPAVRAAIAPDAVLIEMLAYRPVALQPDLRRTEAAAPRYAAYVVRRDAATRFVDLGEVDGIDKAVGELRRALAAPNSLARARETARQLDARVMQPLRAAIGGTATTLLIAPEGLLNLVPFAALVDEEGRYLLERYEINVLASGRDLLRLSSAPAAPRGPALIVADPTFATAGAAAPPSSIALANVTFEPLPGTAAEAAAIRALLPGATLLTGRAATKAALQAARGPRLLHIATHGYFLEQATTRARRVDDAMLRSGLVFAGSNVLTALEAAALDLTGTQLVVLSACETGLGEIQNGEGVFGLRRAFVVAGTGTLVMSLWEVADEATQRLMSDYYRRLAAGAGRIAALRLAQLALRADAQLEHPFYWAAFIASGQSAPLR